MAVKLSSRQLAQQAWLETLPPRFERVKKTIEMMAILQADEVSVRGMARQLDELKAQAQDFGLNGLAEAAGIMAALGRRGGGLQMRVRGLRDGLVSLRIHYDGALRRATTPEAEGGEKDGG